VAAPTVIGPGRGRPRTASRADVDSIASVVRSTVRVPNEVWRSCWGSRPRRIEAISDARPTPQFRVTAAMRAMIQKAAKRNPVSKKPPERSITPGAGAPVTHGAQLLITNSARAIPVPTVSEIVLLAFRTSGAITWSIRAVRPRTITDPRSRNVGYVRPSASATSRKVPTITSEFLVRQLLTPTQNRANSAV